MYFLINYLICSFLFFISSESSRLHDSSEITHSWGYEDYNGPDKWEGICQSGSKQSPINIKLQTVKPKNYPSLEFCESYLLKRRMSVVNNGHTVQVTIRDNSTKPFLSGGGLNGKFVFEQLHFHWESEHEFDGKRAALEMHLVHFNEKYLNISEAATHSDGIAVFAVLFDVSEETDDGIEEFFDYLTESIIHQEDLTVSQIPQVDNSIEDDRSKEMKSFSLKHLIPKETTGFFRYHGSLTTPTCDEVVQWTIFKNRLPISNKAVNILRNIPDSHGNLLLHNYRPPQGLNGRDVFLQIPNSDNNEEGYVLNDTNSINIKLSIFYFVCASVFLHLKN